ncbi:exodeoxyribonuclease V subunit gamma [Geobacter sp. FeAm09]|uniref:exodeoxyribonuclease V subunit gamma n=1 Tax=Geobacter sp. FeAm09 TaxID=2597769 RepID=UPI0011EEBDEE|nr:exodeoxyribonuclease V subunit gamma [Geobacter sp. FeAm09]QEM68787.1 exodeoxyribonuclease V subunit gamma [Geobacter sp. FeAm09]
MGALKVITSNSLTRLAATLAGDLAGSPTPPLGRDTVVVLNPGMARWLSLELATTRGVAAGLDFPFPNQILDTCFRALIPGVPDNSPFTRERMSWRIAARLPALLSRPGFEQAAGYLGAAADGRRLLQISRILADQFDQYVMFRPEMVLAWDRGRDDGWQADLWREISAGCAGQHRAAHLGMFRERIRQGAHPAGTLPHRINLFGISYLPPFHLEAFSLLARTTEVVFYLQNPCGAFWGDLVSRRRLAELALRESPDAEEYYDTGNPLLSSLGTMGQEFHDMLLEYGFDTTDLDDGDEQPGGTLLQAIQNDIRQLRDSGGRDERIVVAPGDRSLHVHSCHGPLREMEVLYDNLLAMFDELDGLEPRHIVVMIPDIEAFAPYIAAVFGTQAGGRPAIPFTIADRSQRRENPLMEIFARILELPATRFGVNQILELLEAPPVLDRFAITPDELEAVRGWLSETGVRWGFDAHQRAELGFPPFAEFSWQAALDRLFLGYALEPDSDRLFHGILPFGDIEGRSAVPLGKLAEFLLAARTAAKRLSGSHSLAAWADILASTAQDLMRAGNGEDGLKPLFDSLQTLREAEEVSGFKTPINLEAVREALNGLLDDSGGGFGFLGGRVTFCAMLPMRSIPFRVICLCGMNDGIFPRNKRQPGFSLLSGKRRRGDRSVRDEDRYLFLETLISARERLHISYTGQSDRDNSVIPPSVVVAELLDYVARGAVVAGLPETPPPVLVNHRLQAFSPDYFSPGADAQLFSYSTEYRDALTERRISGPATRRFTTEPLPDDPELVQEIELRELLRFLGSPCAVFLARRLGVRPFDPAEEVQERELFRLDGMAAYGLRQDLVRQALSGTELGTGYETARARALLPPLAAGETAYREARDESQRFAGLVAPFLDAEREPLAVAFGHNGMTLRGALSGIRQTRCLRWRCAAMKAKDRLTLWVEHLVLNALAPAGYPCRSLLFCNDLSLALAPLDNAAAILGDLLDLYREGLKRPLPFFPQASWLYLTAGMDKAEGRWTGSDHAPYPAESAEPSNSICFGDTNPLGQEFAELSRRVFEPMRAVATEEKMA